MAMPAHIYNETLEYKSNIDVTSGSVFFSPTSGTKGMSLQRTYGKVG
jgi:hypothetical protein